MLWEVLSGVLSFWAYINQFSFSKLWNFLNMTLKIFINCSGPREHNPTIMLLTRTVSWIWNVTGTHAILTNNLGYLGYYLAGSDGSIFWWLVVSPAVSGVNCTSSYYISCCPSNTWPYKILKFSWALFLMCFKPKVTLVITFWNCISKLKILCILNPTKIFFIF